MRFFQKIFNSYFELIAYSLVVFSRTCQLNISDDTVQNVVEIFSNNPSIIKIKWKLRFSLESISEVTIRKFLKKLWSDKATAREIQINMLKDSETCLFELTN